MLPQQKLHTIPCPPSQPASTQIDRLEPGASKLRSCSTPASASGSPGLASNALWNMYTLRWTNPRPPRLVAHPQRAQHLAEAQLQPRQTPSGRLGPLPLHGILAALMPSLSCVEFRHKHAATLCWRGKKWKECRVNLDAKASAHST